MLDEAKEGDTDTEEELIEAGDADSAAKADTIRQVRIAAEAVKGSREL